MSSIDDQARRRTGIVFGSLVPIAVAALLVGVRGEIQTTNVALLLVVVVVGAAAIGGRVAGVCGALAAALAYEFFFTRPYLHVRIADPDDVETTVLLVVVGLVVGHVAAGAWQARESAAVSGDEIRRIHRVAEAGARRRDAGSVIAAASQELVGLLALEACYFDPSADGRSLPRLEPNGQIGTRMWRLASRGFELPPEGVELPVYGRGEECGRFVLRPTPGVGVTPEQRLAAVTIADQVGSALAALRIGEKA